MSWGGGHESLPLERKRREGCNAKERKESREVIAEPNQSRRRQSKIGFLSGCQPALPHALPVFFFLSVLAAFPQLFV